MLLQILNSHESDIHSVFFSAEAVGLNQAPPSAPTACGNVKIEEINSLGLQGKQQQTSQRDTQEEIGIEVVPHPFPG